MKFNKLLSRVSILSIVFFTLFSCRIVKKTEEAIRAEVLATYTGKKITRGEIEDYYAGFNKALEEKYGKDYRSNAKYINEQLKVFAKNYAENGILIQEFDNRGIATDEEISKEVDNVVSEILKQFIDNENGTIDYGNGNKINETLLNETLAKSFYMNLDDFKRKQVDIIKINKLVEDLVKDIVISEDEMRKYYEDNKEQKYSKKPGAVMYHILVATEEEALKVKERLQSGEDYGEIAKELNKDSTSQTGGSLGYVEYGSTSYDQDFLNAAKELKEGEISDPVKTKFGYHIIKVTGVNQDVVYDDFESVKSKIEEKLLTEKKQTTVLEFSEKLFKEKNLKVK